MIHITVFLQKDAESRNIALEGWLEPSVRLFQRLEVVLFGSYGLVQCGMEVIVEVGVTAGVPREFPPGKILVRFDLVYWSARDGDKVGVL